MAHQDHIVDRLSTRLHSILPDHIREDAPVFESFLEAYFEYLESEIITLEGTQDLSGVELEEGTQLGAGDLTLEDGGKILIPLINSTDNAEPDSFERGEYIVGAKSGSVAKILVRSKDVLIVDTISGTGFAIGEKITGRDGGQTSTIKTYKENSIVANNRLLDYADIDNTLETFLTYFQKDFIPSLDLGDTQNKRLTLKNIGTLYKQKGTADSIKFLMRILYGLNSSVKFPIDETVFASKNDFGETRVVFVQMDSGEFSGVPKATDKIVQYSTTNPDLKIAEAIVESVNVINVSNRQYQLSISRFHDGVFQENQRCTLVDRDGVTSYFGTLKGIISEVISEDSSTTFGLEGEVGDLCLEDGTVDTSTVGGALLFEGSTIGSMYDINDVIEFTGAKTDTEEVNARGVIEKLSRGPIEKVYIETAGSGYSAGDIVVFDDEGTEGNGAEAIIAAVGDEITLENASALDQYELEATAGQTVFGGLGVVDLNNKPIALNGLKVKVFVDGIEQSANDFTISMDRVTFTTSPTPTGGERVEIISKYSRLVKEDGEAIYLESSDQRIREVKITSGGAGYQKLPKIYPGGYLYFDDVSGFTKGEVVTGGTSNATGTILKIDTQNNRLVIRRSPTDTGEFVLETITGGSSSTSKLCILAKVTAGEGGNIFAWSSKVGGIEKLRLSDPGYNFDENAVLSGESYFNMLISDPTSSANLVKGITITGQSSGATGVVRSFDDQRNILKFETRTGTFLPDEVVEYTTTPNTFTVLKFDPYDARGKLAGESVINDNFFGDTGYLSNEFSNLQDGKIYQTHSYIIKVGESIDKYRSVVKDLVHPSGHIFFGEVAVERNVLSNNTLDNRFSEGAGKDVDSNNALGVQSTTFVPVIKIELEVRDHFTLEDGTIRDFNSYNDKSNRLLHEDGSHIDSEDAFEPSVLSHSQTMLLFHTTQAELTAFDMGHVLRDYLNEGTEVERHRVEIIKKFISSATNTIIDNEVTGVVAPVAETRSTFLQKSPRLDGAITVLNLSNLNTQGDGYLIQDKEDAVSPIGVRPQDQGKVFQFWQPAEEHIVMEDGSNIQLEEPLNHLIHEPTGRDVGGDLIQFEDATKIYELTDPNDEDSYDPATSTVLFDLNGSVFLLEDNTVPEHIERFVTERSNVLSNPYIYLENNQDRIVLETGEPLVKEQSGTGNTIYSFAPLGPKFKSINKIAFQDTYRIAYYLLDESIDSSEEDRIVLESGTEGGSGHILLEETKRDGMRVSQLNELLGTQYVGEYNKQENRRVNIAFSSYVNSTNITNSTLESL